MNQRTLLQNRSLHLYCQMLADEMNAAGYDFRKVIKVPVTFTGDNVKENMFKVIMNAMYCDKDSTTELSTVEIQNVYETMNAATAEKFGISIPWPDRFHQESG